MPHSSSEGLCEETNSSILSLEELQATVLTLLLVIDHEELLRSLHVILLR